MTLPMTGALVTESAAGTIGSAVTYLSRIARLVLLLLAIAGVLTASIAYAAPRVLDFVGSHTSDREQIDLDPLAERSYIYDSKGNLQGVLINSENENRVAVPLEEVPETVVGAVLAAEDEKFYEHKGINLRSIGRAVDANLDAGSASQGGSTITQQVVKNSLVGNEQDLSRKIREAFLAVELEKQLKEEHCPKPVQSDCTAGKDQILERYLNSVYFGGGSYGVQAASEYYFRKNVRDLNWAEGAMLAALIRSPNAYDPFEDPDLARERRSIVFTRLVATERLTEEEVAFWEQVPLPTEPNVPQPPNDYFVEAVKQQLLDDPRFGLGATPAARNRTVFEGGIRVFTTFDPDLQAKAIQARDETIPNNQGNGTFAVTDPTTGQPTFGTQAIASVEPGTGAVRAMVGGPGFDTWKFNLATQLPGRQPGSAMKTLVLASAFEKGYVPADTISGSRCTFDLPGVEEPYSPATGRGGTANLTRQTQSSSNCAFVRLGQAIGIDGVIELAQRLGVRSPLAEVASLPLGTSDITPLDMAAAYATFANDGVRHEPFLVERIEDRDGNVIYQHQFDPVQVVDPQVARMINQVLEANVTGGTGRNARITNGQPAAGKTGTTNESSDVWFVGYTPQLSTAIWMGAPEGRISLANAGLGGATGGRYPATTWGRYYSLVFEGQPIEEFVAPDPTRRGRFIDDIPNEVVRRRPAPAPSTGGPTGQPPADDAPTGVDPPAVVPTSPSPTTPGPTVSPGGA